MFQNRILSLIILAFCAAVQTAFAQEPERFAVYVSGGEAGVNKSLGDKLAASISNSGSYAELRDPDAFQKEAAKKAEPGAMQVAEIAKRHGADFLCAVSITEALGAHSISARLIRTDNLTIAKAVSLDHSIKTLEDLTAVSNELAARLFNVSPAQSAAPAAALAPQAPAPAEPAAAAPQQCEETFNINELLAKLQHGFPAQLSDCANKLAKDIALSKVPFSKTPAPEPKSYLTQCAMDGMKSRLPEGFPGIDKAMDDTQKFLQTVLTTALAGGPPNPAALLKAASDMSGLLDGVKNLGADNPCVVDEPYEYVEPVKEEEEAEEGGDSEGKKKKFSLGIIGGMNFSHLYAEYDDDYHRASGTYESMPGFQAGFVLDIIVSEFFYIQPSIMYIQKAAGRVTSHNIETPLLFSLKFSAFRINAGPYYDILVHGVRKAKPSSSGINTGLGFDMNKFYIGIFYDYGLTKSYQDSYVDAYDRTLGFNLGINL